MPILAVNHVTTYHYKQPVAFGEHRMMLRPRDDGDQKVLESELKITPEPSQLAWTQDIFGNHVAIARFADRASELRFASVIRLDHAPADFRAADIDDFARSYPFAYAADDRPDLARFIAPLSPHPELDRWAAKFLREDGSADTSELLINLTRTINQTFRHVARHYRRCRRGPGGTAHRMRRVAAIESEAGGVFAHHAVDGIGVHEAHDLRTRDCQRAAELSVEGA